MSGTFAPQPCRTQPVVQNGNGPLEKEQALADGAGFKSIQFKKHDTGMWRPLSEH